MKTWLPTSYYHRILTIKTKEIEAVTRPYIVKWKLFHMQSYFSKLISTGMEYLSQHIYVSLIQPYINATKLPWKFQLVVRLNIFSSASRQIFENTRDHTSDKLLQISLWLNSKLMPCLQCLYQIRCHFTSINTMNSFIVDWDVRPMFLLARWKACPTMFIGIIIQNKHVYNVTSCFKMHNASVPVRCMNLDWLNWKTVIWKYIRSWPLCIVILTRSQVQLSVTIIVGMNQFCRDIAVLFITLMRHV